MMGYYGKGASSWHFTLFGSPSSDENSCKLGAVGRGTHGCNGAEFCMMQLCGGAQGQRFVVSEKVKF